MGPEVTQRYSEGVRAQTTSSEHAETKLGARFASFADGALDRWPGLRDPDSRRTLLVMFASVVTLLAGIAIGMARSLVEVGIDVAPWQVFLAFLGLVGMSALQAVIDRPPRQALRKERIVELSGALSQAAELVDELRAEIAEGERLASQYQADVARFEKLAALKRDEVEAVAVELRSELRSGERRGFAVGLLTNILVGAAFFALGVWVGV